MRNSRRINEGVVDGCQIMKVKIEAKQPQNDTNQNRCDTDESTSMQNSRMIMRNSRRIHEGLVKWAMCPDESKSMPIL